MLNQSRLDELKSEVGEDDFYEVVEVFCEEVEEVLAELEGATSIELLKKLHFLKGSALNIGLDGVSKLCGFEESRLKEDPNHPPDICAIRSCYEASKANLGLKNA